MATRATGAGELRERIILQRQVVTPDGLGGEERSWQRWTERAAEVLPLVGDETPLADGLVGRQRWLIRLRWLDGVDITTRIVWRGHTLNVTGAADRTGRRAFLWITAESGGVTD